MGKLTVEEKNDFLNDKFKNLAGKVVFEFDRNIYIKLKETMNFYDQHEHPHQYNAFNLTISELAYVGPELYVTFCHAKATWDRDK